MDNNSSGNFKNSITAAKCAGLFLGGASILRGRNGSAIGAVLCCDAVRCTKCDFRVITFDNQAWDAGVDYLFFRNNYPTHEKLAPRLHRQVMSGAGWLAGWLGLSCTLCWYVPSCMLTGHG